MEIHVIICIDDEPEVLDSVTRTLAQFEDFFPIETAESAKDARDLVESIIKVGNHLALVVCDHLMPGETGVALLSDLARDSRLPLTRKILLTGQASHEDTIDAINQGGIDYYVTKPWDADTLVEIVSKQLAHFFVNLGHLPPSGITGLDPFIISEAIREGYLLVDG